MKHVIDCPLTVNWSFTVSEPGVKPPWYQKWKAYIESAFRIIKYVKDIYGLVEDIREIIPINLRHGQKPCNSLPTVSAI